MNGINDGATVTTRVKICGVRSRDEAEMAVAAGADAIGFNLWPGSPRFIEAVDAAKIIKGLPPFAIPVGVFVNEAPERVSSLANALGLTLVQLHGDEDSMFCSELKAISPALRIIKAIRVGEEFDATSLANYPADAVLLDSSVAGSYGGTGVRFDWRIAIEAQSRMPVILAGGLDPSNVGQAILKVHPYAVDVCSGVESEPGRKDARKVAEFVTAVRRADEKGQSSPTETGL